MINNNVKFIPEKVLALGTKVRSLTYNARDFREVAPALQEVYSAWREAVEDGDMPDTTFARVCHKICGVSYGYFLVVLAAARAEKAIKRHVDKTNRPLAYMVKWNLAQIPATMGISHFIPLLVLHTGKAQYTVWMRALVLARKEDEKRKVKEQRARGLLVRHVRQAVVEHLAKLKTPGRGRGRARHLLAG